MPMKTKSLFLSLLLLLGCTMANAKESLPVMAKTPILVMETTQGTIEITLKPDVAPKACENIIRLAENGYYDGIIFHRVIKGFMVQGGDPTGTGSGGESIWHKDFEDEFNPEVKFDRPGVLAMAKPRSWNKWISILHHNGSDSLAQPKTYHFWGSD